MIVLIDNYDSFTYNLVQYFQILGQVVSVYKNDEINCLEIEALAPQSIVISPGPNSPEQAGISLELIQNFYTKFPILGICLGHQCLAKYFGAKICRAKEVLHGKTSIITHNYQRLFQDIPNQFKAARYHSLLVDVGSLPSSLCIDAWAENDIMAISHQTYPLFGLQFHPEAILSEYGLQLLNNFLKYNNATKGQKDKRQNKEIELSI
jgi:anthranilate synthase/aminodeoxychorismate synthase-like glutamine amidotransferase